MRSGSDLVFVGDVHLDRDDPELSAFLVYLRDLGRSAGRIVLMGDLFNLWLADPDLEQDHHRAVLEAIREVRRSGTEVHYLEGNRDYRVGHAHRGTAFDAVSDEGLEERWAGRRIWAAHGDLVNSGDRQYRLWRRFSRSSAVWAAITWVPPRRRFALAERIERGMRSTNPGMKRRFPVEAIRAGASRLIGAGYDTVVLGHFHEEQELTDLGERGAGRVFVLPLWRDRRRHLRLSAQGTFRFEGA